MMILQIATSAAFLVNQAQQAPIVMQCAPNAGQDPLWSRLLVTAIPSLLALGIAWMAFRWNSQKDKERWVLDQKKAEWKELFESLSGIFSDCFPLSMNEDAARKFINDIQYVRRRLAGVPMRFIFIAQVLNNERLQSKLNKLIKIIEEEGELMQTILNYAHESGAIDGLLNEKYNSIVEAYNELVAIIREVAERDIKISVKKDVGGTTKQ
jgi:hypothetical protein